MIGKLKSNRSDEGLMLEMSAFLPFTVAQLLTLKYKFEVAVSIWKMGVKSRGVGLCSI